MDVVRVQLQDVETHAISAIASSTTPGCESSHPTTQDKRKDISKLGLTPKSENLIKTP